MKCKHQIISKLLETIENISSKAVQPNPLRISQLHFADDSTDMNESEREEIKVPETNNTSNNQKDSARIEQFKFREKNIIVLKTTFKVMLLKKIQQQKKDNG